jgi:hypothetical protein
MEGDDHTECYRVLVCTFVHLFNPKYGLLCIGGFYDDDGRVTFYLARLLFTDRFELRNLLAVHNAAPTWLVKQPQGHLQK